MSVIDELIRADIGVHTESQRGKHITAGIDQAVLRWLAANLRSDMRTLETGCGLSTAVFAASGTDHSCISPFADEHERIAAWCAGQGVDTAQVRFIDGRSDLVLPALDVDELDLALIDGSHAFPHAFIDYWYMALKLKSRGLLIVDDLQLWTGETLYEFLGAQPGWELVQDWSPRAAVFRKTGPIEVLGAWTRQPYVVKRSVDAHGLKGAKAYLALLRRRKYRWALMRARGAARRRLG